jgi:hypothetical protein
MARVCSLSGTPRWLCCWSSKSCLARGTPTPLTVAMLLLPLAAGFALAAASFAGSLVGKVCAKAGTAITAAASIQIFIVFLSFHQGCAR